MSNKSYDYKTFNLDKNISIDCHTYKTRYSWGHKAELLIDGRIVSYKKITYYNRTWEAYTYQTILENIVSSCKQLTKDQVKKYLQIIQDQSFSQDRDLGIVGTIAKMGEVLTDNKKDSNEWKKRMLKAGLEKQGLTFPTDWDNLTEEEKEKRLNGAISQL